MGEIFNHTRIHRYWVPVLYILIWTSSLFVGVAGWLPQACNDMERYIITGWTVYAIFILDTLVYFVDMNSSHFEKQFGSNIFLYMASFLLLVLTTILSSWLLQRYQGISWVVVMIISMALSKACISYFANNLDLFFYKNRGRVLYSTY